MQGKSSRMGAAILMTSFQAWVRCGGSPDLALQQSSAPALHTKIHLYSVPVAYSISTINLHELFSLYHISAHVASNSTSSEYSLHMHVTEPATVTDCANLDKETWRPENTSIMGLCVCSPGARINIGS